LTAMTKSLRVKSLKRRMISNLNKFARSLSILLEKPPDKLEFGEAKMDSSHRVLIQVK